jgi:exopolysaccharide biosynthesis polyprenyl glycosylphosphotransferase
MLRRDKLIRMQVHELLDACLFALAFWLAYELRSNEGMIEWFKMAPVSPFERYTWLYLVLLPVAPMVLEAQGFYNRPALCSRLTTAWLLLKGCCIVSLGLVVALFVFRFDIARWVIVWFGVISFVLVFAKEELMFWILRSRLAQSQYRRRFILVGTSEETARMRTDLKAKSHDAIAVLGELNLNEQPVQRLIEMLHEFSVNGVIISAKRAYFDQVEAAINACEIEGVDAWLVADFFKTQICRTSFDEFLDRPVLVFSSTPEASWQGVLKQALDFIGALVLLILLTPLLLAVGILIKVSSPGPVFFRQQRSGLNGHPFTIFKFRTMVTNAEQLKHELAAMNEMTGPVFKVTNDPRITSLGTFLRQKSIDELPQLLNVLRGEMSLVGPRPLPVDEVRRFNDLAHRRRLSVKPGLTCLWQISGRNQVKDFRDWVLEYIDNWSLWLDVKILFRTVPVVLLGTGAK